MANPTVTYTFVNGNVADASQVNQNFTDIINSLTDGTKSINIDSLTVGGTLTANGAVDLGNAAGDTISMTGYIDTNVTIKSTDGGATAGPDLIIDRDSTSAADSDAIGRIIFRGNDDAGTPADNDYASIEASIVDSGAGSEDGKIDFKISEAGTSTSYLTIEATKGVAIKGRTDGASVSSGYVGQRIMGTINTGSMSVVTNYAIGTIVLNKGIYMLYGGATLQVNGTTSAWSSRSEPYIDLGINTITTAIGDHLVRHVFVASNQNDNVVTPVITKYLEVTADSSTYYLVGYILGNNTGTFTVYNNSGFYALRIA